MNNSKKIFQFITILLLAQAACNIPTEATPTLDLPVTFTHVAETRTALAKLPPTLTLTPTFPPTPFPALSPVPTATPICDVAVFVTDVTLPDNTSLKFGEQQPKTWRIRNIGSCTWTTEYSIVYDHGDKLSTNDSYPMPGNIPPGEIVDITIPVTAPNTRGLYQSNWLLRNNKGQKFGLQRAGTDPSFWVKIIANDAFYDFVQNACLAEWVTTAGKVKCPGQSTDSQGYNIPFLSTKMRAEDNQEYTYGLLVSPAWVDNSFISGTYPSIKIESGYHFRAQIGCLYQQNNSNCNIEFQLNYLLTPGESPRNLLEADQIADGYLANVDIDLSTFTGESIQFILTAITNGTSNDDLALWIAPRLGP